MDSSQLDLILGGSALFILIAGLIMLFSGVDKIK